MPKLGYVTLRLGLNYCMNGLSHRNLIIAVLVKEFPIVYPYSNCCDLGPCIQMQSIAVTVRFLITLFEEGVESGFIRFTDTCHI